jgi:hypothetical protein
MQCKVLDAGKVEFVRVQQDYQTTISIKHRERSGEFIEEISIFPRAEDSEEKEKMLLQRSSTFEKQESLWRNEV